MLLRYLLRLLTQSELHEFNGSAVENLTSGDLGIGQHPMTACIYLLLFRRVYQSLFSAAEMDSNAKQLA